MHFDNSIAKPYFIDIDHTRECRRNPSHIALHACYRSTSRQAQIYLIALLNNLLHCVKCFLPAEPHSVSTAFSCSSKITLNIYNQTQYLNQYLQT